MNGRNSEGKKDQSAVVPRKEHGLPAAQPADLWISMHIKDQNVSINWRTKVARPNEVPRRFNSVLFPFLKGETAATASAPQHDVKSF